MAKKIIDSSILASLLSQLKTKLSAIFCTKEEAQAAKPAEIVIAVSTTTYKDLAAGALAMSSITAKTAAALENEMEACAFKLILKYNGEIYIPDYVSLSSRTVYLRVFINGDHTMLEYNSQQNKLKISTHTPSI